MRLLPVYLSLTGACLALTFAFSNCSKVGFSDQPIEEVSRDLAAKGGSILINNGADYTNDVNVNLSLTANSATEMYITDVPGCGSGGQWEPFTNFKKWQLKSTNSEQKVYVKYRELADGTPTDCLDDGIIHDDVPPEVDIVKNIQGFVNSSNVPFEYAVTDNLSGIGSVDCTSNPAWKTGCDQAIKIHMLSEGQHYIRIQATDKAGNISLPKLAAVTVDLTPPVVTFNQTPQSLTASVNATFAFSAVDELSGVAGYECKPSMMAAYQSCSSPFSSQFANGPQKFFVRAVDNAGNVSPEISYNWTIDNLAPTVRIISGPAPWSNSATANFTFEGSKNGVALTKFECSLNNGAYVPCSSPVAYNNLIEGAHSFQVRGYDNLNNVSAPAPYNWQIDLTKPVVQLTSTPSNPSKDASANFAFTATDNGSGIKVIECSLNGGTYAACVSPKSYMNLPEGTHTFSVRATDNAGNVGNAVSYSWRVDLTKPTVTIISGPAAQVSDMNATLTFVADDGAMGQIARIECQFDLEAAFTECTSPKNYMGLAEGSHLFQVRAIDAAGWVSDVKTHTWFVDTLPPAINISQMPAATIYTSDVANVQFAVTDAGVGIASVKCGLNGALNNCQANDLKSFTNLPPGDYTFRIEATDLLGNSAAKTVTWKSTYKTQDFSQTVAVNVNNKADVLVVIDNSGSMSEEQKSMATRFGSFLDKLAGLDWQVGIITTDMEPVRRGIQRPYTDGRFLPMSGAPSGTYLLNSAMPIANAKTYFANTIQRPSNEGSAYEQGIAATVKAIQRAKDPSNQSTNAPNRAFFRDGAVLSVLVVTDADETNQYGTQQQNTPAYLQSLVASSFPGKPFKFHSIIVKPGDTVCRSKSNNEGYGTTYANLSNATGGVIGTVCSTDYAGQLAEIGQATVDLINSVTLDCAPMDKTGDNVPDIQVMTADGSTPPSYTVQGNKVQFSMALPPGNNVISYTCIIP